MEWFLANWEYCMAGFYCLEKIVKVTPVKWDDILVDGIRAMISGVKTPTSTIK